MPAGSFYVYENWTNTFAKVHRGDYPYCNEGRGFQGRGTSTPSGRWLGPALADRFGVRVRYIRRLVAERRIPYIKLGHLLRFDLAEVDAWVDRARIQESDPRLGPGR